MNPQDYEFVVTINFIFSKEFMLMRDFFPFILYSFHEYFKSNPFYVDQATTTSFFITADLFHWMVTRFGSVILWANFSPTTSWITVLIVKMNH